ncbi:hypothetical protein E4416_13660 [Stenotrophomonas maltophilia]|nr:hypothetical protein E4418_15685 [Stenotrophomonas maltophilia]TIK71726.1 hypothetical protein E4416_13660 [Stenotrophomonas maltophilia]
MPAAGRQPLDARIRHEAAGRRPALPAAAVAIHVTAVAIAAGVKRHSASSRDRNVPVPQGSRHSSPPTVSFSHSALCL